MTGSPLRWMAIGSLKMTAPGSQPTISRWIREAIGNSIQN